MLTVEQDSKKSTELNCAILFNEPISKQIIISENVKTTAKMGLVPIEENNFKFGGYFDS